VRFLSISAKASGDIPKMAKKLIFIYIHDMPLSTSAETDIQEAFMMSDAFHHELEKSGKYSESFIMDVYDVFLPRANDTEFVVPASVPTKVAVLAKKGWIAGKRRSDLRKKHYVLYRRMFAKKRGVKPNV